MLVHVFFHFCHLEFWHFIFKHGCIHGSEAKIFEHHWTFEVFGSSSTRVEQARATTKSLAYRLHGGVLFVIDKNSCYIIICCAWRAKNNRNETDNTFQNEDSDWVKGNSKRIKKPIAGNPSWMLRKDYSKTEVCVVGLLLVYTLVICLLTCCLILL